MILEVLSVGLVISACLAIFLDEAVYSVASLAATFLFMSLLYGLNGALFVAIFQFAVGVGTLAILFLSGEMLSEKPAKKVSLRYALIVLVVGALLSLPALFLNVSSPAAGNSALAFGDALWDLRATDVVVQGLVVMIVAIGVAIVLYEKKGSGEN